MYWGLPTTMSWFFFPSHPSPFNRLNPKSIIFQRVRRKCFLTNVVFQNHVLGFQISVNDSSHVQGSQSSSNLCNQCGNFFLTEMSCVVIHDVIEELTALTQLNVKYRFFASSYTWKKLQRCPDDHFSLFANVSIYWLHVATPFAHSLLTSHAYRFASTKISPFIFTKHTSR